MVKFFCTYSTGSPLASKLGVDIFLLSYKIKSSISLAKLLHAKRNMLIIERRSSAKLSQRIHSKLCCLIEGIVLIP